MVLFFMLTLDARFQSLSVLLCRDLTLFLILNLKTKFAYIFDRFLDLLGQTILVEGFLKDSLI